jgi:hypothetical protein
MSHRVIKHQMPFETVTIHLPLVSAGIRNKERLRRWLSLDSPANPLLSFVCTHRVGIYSAGGDLDRGPRGSRSLTLAQTSA